MLPNLKPFRCLVDRTCDQLYFAGQELSSIDLILFYTLRNWTKQIFRHGEGLWSLNSRYEAITSFLRADTLVAKSDSLSLRIVEIRIATVNIIEILLDLALAVESNLCCDLNWHNRAIWATQAVFPACQDNIVLQNAFLSISVCPLHRARVKRQCTTIVETTLVLGGIVVTNFTGDYIELAVFVITLGFNSNCLPVVPFFVISLVNNRSCVLPLNHSILIKFELIVALFNCWVRDIRLKSWWVNSWWVSRFVGGLVWALKADSSINPLVSTIVNLFLVVHDKGKVWLRQLDRLVVDLNDECIRLNIAYGQLNSSNSSCACPRFTFLRLTMTALKVLTFEK